MDLKLLYEKIIMNELREKTDIAIKDISEASFEIFHDLMQNEDNKKEDEIFAATFMKQYGHLFQKKANTFYFLNEPIKKSDLYHVFCHIIISHFFKFATKYHRHLDKDCDLDILYPENGDSQPIKKIKCIRRFLWMHRTQLALYIVLLLLEKKNKI